MLNSRHRLFIIRNIEISTDSKAPNGAPSEGRRWLALGAASRVMDVNEATLRQWADHGLIKVFRTPGGHRRFFREDLHRILKGRSNAPTQDERQRWEDAVLKRIRRHLSNGSVADEPWFTSVDQGAKNRMRLFGRRLLSLLAQAALEKRRRPDLRAEAHALGKEYGLEMAARGLPLSEPVEAYIFFRNLVAQGTQRNDWPHVAPLEDQVLLGITAAYEERVSGKQPGPVMQNRSAE